MEDVFVAGGIGPGGRRLSDSGTADDPCDILVLPRVLEDGAQLPERRRFAQVPVTGTDRRHLGADAREHLVADAVELTVQNYADSSNTDPRQ